MLENIPNLANIMILAAIAGFVSSILGGVIVICISRPGKKFIGLSFIFAATVLLTLVFVDFIPHAIGHSHGGHHHSCDHPHHHDHHYDDAHHHDSDHHQNDTHSHDSDHYHHHDTHHHDSDHHHHHDGAGLWLALLGIAVGIGLVAILSFFDKKGHEHVHGVLPHSEHCSHSDEVNNAPLTSRERRRILSAAIPVIFAIILHDLPKGLAIGSSGSVLVAISIGLSCIPEGMTIAIPLKAGGKAWWKILGVCGFAGLATVVGAVIGYLVGGINVYLSGMMFAIAAGCILGVVFSEILPLAFEYSGRTKLKFLVMGIGVLLIIALNYFFHDLSH